MLFLTIPIYDMAEWPFNIRVIFTTKDGNRSVMADMRNIFHGERNPVLYGEKKFGTFKYNTRFDREPTILDINWEYNRVGGCGIANITIAYPQELHGNISFGMDVAIQCRATSDVIYETWYSGEIASKNIAFGNPDVMNIHAQGYVSQLDFKPDDLDNIEYQSSDTGAISANIIDSFLVNIKDVLRTASKALVVTTPFTVDSIVFTGTVMEAIRTLAELTGNAEWGVNSDKEFFFLIRGSAVTWSYESRNLQTINQSTDYTQIRNKYKLYGGGTYTREKRDTTSEAKYGLRSDVLQQSFISGDTLADEYINGFLEETKNPIETIGITTMNVRSRFEGTWPLGLIEIKNQANDTRQSYQIENINYSLGSNGVVARITGGRLKKSVVETLSYLEYKLTQETNR